MPNVEVAERAGDRLTPPEPGTTASEDVVLVLPNAVAVSDGATSLHPGARTGGWYAARLAEALEPRLAQPEADLADLLASAIAELVVTFGLQPGASPSSTASLLRWDDEHVEALVLADSPIVLDTSDGARAVTDEQLASLRSRSGRRPGTGYRDRLRSGEGFGAGHREALGSAMQRTSQWRNVDGGFWVAEAVPEAAAHASRARIPRREVTTAMVMTDGVSCGVQDYGIYQDWSAMLAVAVRNGPDALLDQVRAAEMSDPGGVRWPRPKRHDDQALAVVRFTDA
ncbi:protein phosphatase 2C domain-containing protein [Saccharopolyspora gloriosae]|uniref:protein phosphatase 2C domain-containing protein n=1 Tax=Saccharopolyspora gloriosae TaxID=455344 RepID=UPI001FB73F2F|nr:protein phosphatase 2C domain-containing protein [Saccharopolyspora gloriosae]